MAKVTSGFIRRNARSNGVVTFVLAHFLVSCRLLFSFDDYDTSAGMAAEFGVTGTVDGLEGDAKVTLVVAGGTRSGVVTVGNGAFVVPPSLADGRTYLLSVQASPAGHACVVERDSGVIAGADASGVAVHCPSTAASLAGLSVSVGPLVPAFSPDVRMFETRLQLRLPVPAMTATLTATAVSRNARVTIAGASVASGAMSPPIALRLGRNPVEVIVAAPDPKTPPTKTTVVVNATASEYVKASDTRAEATFGSAMAVSGDTLVVGSPVGEAVYVFTRAGNTWSQQATLTASNRTEGFGNFGTSLALDGDTLVVGAPIELGPSIGINGSQVANPSTQGAGAVYVFVRSGTNWSQQAYIKASNTRVQALFGSDVAFSGNTLAVGSSGESSSASGVNANQSDTAAPRAGAVYVFARTGVTWSQEAYLKASNARTEGRFGLVALSGNTLAVGAKGEPSNSTVIDQGQSDSSAPSAGAVYVFTRAGATWSQQAYVKASNTRPNALFGSVSLSGDTLAVGSECESSGGGRADTSAPCAGAAYVFMRAAGTWSEQAYIKASNTRAFAAFGATLRVVGDRLAVGSHAESSATGDPANSAGKDTGAVYLFDRSGATWMPTSYVKASTPHAGDRFGFSVALSATALGVGAPGEASAAKGVNGDEANTSAPRSGAAYFFGL